MLALDCAWRFSYDLWGDWGFTCRNSLDLFHMYGGICICCRPHAVVYYCSVWSLSGPEMLTNDFHLFYFCQMSVYDWSTHFYLYSSIFLREPVAAHGSSDTFEVEFPCCASITVCLLPLVLTFTYICALTIQYTCILFYLESVLCSAYRLMRRSC